MLLLCFLSIFIICGSFGDNDVPYFASLLTDESLTEYVMNKQSLFQAGRCNFSEDWKKSRVMTGFFGGESKKGVDAPEISHISLDSIPNSFDSRTQWPNCQTIKKIYDQSQCGSCWAFCTAETMSDRTCIATTQNVEISADDILSCCTSCGSGCNGGWPANAFNYWISTGVVTGGAYSSYAGCRPYEIPPCSSNCPSGGYKTPTCKQICESNYHVAYSADKHRGQGKAYSVPGSVVAIQKEILAHGPVTATFDVYGDFYQYYGGIYVHTGGMYYGRHCVKIIGWGSDGGHPYWLVANSWGSWWGEKGFFRILRGTNTANFESNIIAALS